MLFKKNKNKIDKEALVKALVAYILNDEELSIPVYLDELNSENDAEQLGLYPAIYIWNECQNKGTFSISVNTKPIAHLLESSLDRNHCKFCEIRDEVAEILSKLTQESVMATCQKTGALPSAIFSV